ncbi:hypothetical protein MPNT_80101 [Candidatus Methylacidithermus pantelleriae]|uniref:Uncharacterized protein n=1 Tax=Candidatus Methylacidithermus pantelleriae TaxID=2744239 RepID=A0A8J2FTX8_9BACT|nr:hypothetical protein MPNT_80101 [Candidatus Methylacidithermus pantelleriae]
MPKNALEELSTSQLPTQLWEISPSVRTCPQADGVGTKSPSG